ncbi:MAG: electron transfer flavoprotein subunit beta/FixA family protein [Proteobacteria bacterium]|nr:electron transfer flavoprotein subunit beta/FixA family protein [Pseudomonadota bacterium]
MKILVCVKQVPYQGSPLEIQEDICWIRDHEDVAYCMNRYDEYAIEEALLLSESFPDTHVDAVSVGPERVSKTLRKALAFGAGHGIHILARSEKPLSPFETASLIASYAKKENYDLVFTGVMAEDDMQCLVGPMLAKCLCIPCQTAAIKTILDPHAKKITVQSEVEGGFYETSALTLPALVTVQSGINIPRYPALSNVLRSKSQKLTVIDAESLSANSEREVLSDISLPEKPDKGVILTGLPEEKADRLLTILHEKSLL